MSSQKEFLTEKELLEACKRGERGAQKLLYEQYAPKMLAVCLRYMGDRGRAMDLLHDSFITLFDKIESYDGRGSFEGWIRRICINNSLMALRRADVLKYSEELSDLSTNFTSESDPLSKISSKELLRVIATMPVGFRTVFNMYAIEGYSHNEIAQELNISEGSSRSQLSRARGWLQQRLKEIK